LKSYGGSPENTRGIVNTLLYAAGAAGAAVAFLWLTNLLFRLTIERLSTGSILGFLVGSLILVKLSANICSVNICNVTT